ncbi:hypothetical protein [Streptantibioticus rubrisoli]|nr:hypothetical protein [Streptantibioticus rubrisoli]
MLDQFANVLLVRPVSASDGEWCLPEHTARAVEEPRGALKRAVHADLGLTVPIGRTLLMDYVPANPHGYGP